MEHRKEDNGGGGRGVLEKMTLLFIRLFVASWDWKMQNFKRTQSPVGEIPQFKQSKQLFYSDAHFSLAGG